MKQIEVNGASLAYLELGEGEPLVLVHGSANDCRTWDQQQAVFAEHFRTVNYSRRYHWPNSEIPAGAEYSMEEQLDDLEAVVLELNAHPAHLVGHSYGGFLSLLLAIRRPDLVRSLVLEEPPVITLVVSDPPKPSEILKLLVSRPLLAFSIIRFGVEGVIPAEKAFERGEIEKGTRLFGSATLGRAVYESMPEERRARVRDNEENARMEVLGPGFIDLSEEDVRAVDAPTLLVTGSESIGLFRRLTDRLEELIPGTRRVEISGSSHTMHEDEPEQFNAAVIRFLSSTHSTD